MKVGMVRTTKGKHNKPSGCSASRAYAPGPDYEEEEDFLRNISSALLYVCLTYTFLAFLNA